MKHILLLIILCTLQALGSHANASDQKKTIEGIPLADATAIEANNGKVLVVGALQVTVGLKNNLSRDRFDLFIKDLNNGKYYTYDIPRHGHFFWYLPPGRYLMATLSGDTYCSDGASPCGDHRIWAKFEVPNNAQAVYIGKLRAFRHYRNFFPKVENNFVEAKKRVKKKFPKFNAPMQVNYMALEERI